MPNLTDWITAVSTAITALGAAVSVAFSAKLLTAEKSKSDPIIEPSATWMFANNLGPYIASRVQIVNRLDETLIIEKIRLCSPSGAYIANSESHGARMFPSLSKTREVSFNRIIKASGEVDDMLMTAMGHGRPTRLDRSVFELHVFPPPEWRGGNVRFEVALRSRARSIEGRHITVDAFLETFDRSKYPAAEQQQKNKLGD